MDKKDDTIRTAVVIVHGMGEQGPTETVNRFVKTALPPSQDPRKPEEPARRRYFSRPAQVTKDFEARLMLAYPQPFTGEKKVHDHFEFFEYHWSYKMVGNRLRDFLPTFLRLVVRLPTRVPYGLRGAWAIVWLLVVLLSILICFGAVFGKEQYIGGGDMTTLATAVVSLVVAAPLVWLVTAVVLWLLRFVGGKVTATFVDVARYLDRSPRSYAVRRDIREGMVELLRGLHDSGRYQRIVVTGHSLGGYIAYDGITALWNEFSEATCGPPPDGTTGTVPLPGREDVQRAGRALQKDWLKRLHDPDRDRRSRHLHHSATIDPATAELLDAYRKAQWKLWKGLRKQGNPWLITDFITFGTPMAFADILLTKNRTRFDELIRRAELPVSPPLPRNQMVEGESAAQTLYSYKNHDDTRWLIYHAAPFAAVRWTNLYFPAGLGFFGDWFGGPLRDLFGPGVLDVPVTGNTGRGPEPRGVKHGKSGSILNRKFPAVAHGLYFSFPDEDNRSSPDGEPIHIAPLLQRYLELTIAGELKQMLRAPEPDPSTYAWRLGDTQATET